MANQFTMATIKAMKILQDNAKQGVPFYAEEVGLNGGQINALALRHYIEPTGNTKERYVEVGDGLYRKVEVQEWKISDPKMLEWVGHYNNEKLKKFAQDIVDNYDFIKRLAEIKL